MDGEAQGPLFEPPADPNALWILIAILAVAAIVLALIALVRGRLPAPIASAGLLLLPVFSYVLGNLFVLEESKRVEFCGSCHETMSPIVESLHSDEPSLAASHFQRGAVPHDNACYECHSGYGIWGTADAKLAGLSHMIHTVTGNYEFPLTVAGSFDINSCLNCHASARPFRAVEAHRDPDLQAQLVSGELSCAGLCHVVAHPESSLMGATAQ